MFCHSISVFEILLHVGLILYRTWIKGSTTIKRRLTCDGKAALTTMVMAAAPADVIASDNDVTDVVQQTEAGQKGRLSMSDRPNCSTGSSSAVPKLWPDHTKHGSSSVEIIETKAAGKKPISPFITPSV